MRLLVTADLHYDTTRSRAPAQAVAREVLRTGGDALVLVGASREPVYLWVEDGEVELRDAKDYWGMAMLLREVPELHATINLVPSLLKQLLAYTELGHVDTHLRVSRLPPDGLSEDDSNYLLDNFFLVHPDRMIRPFKRYHELRQKRGFGIDPPERARKRFTKRDVVDLQIWSNLVWIHPIAFELDKELAEFRAKGRHWTENEKAWLLKKQMDHLIPVVLWHQMHSAPRPLSPIVQEVAQ